MWFVVLLYANELTETMQLTDSKHELICQAVVETEWTETEQLSPEKWELLLMILQLPLSNCLSVCLVARLSDIIPKVIQYCMFLFYQQIQIYRCQSTDYKHFIQHQIKKWTVRSLFFWLSLTDLSCTRGIVTQCDRQEEGLQQLY